MVCDEKVPGVKDVVRHFISKHEVIITDEINRKSRDKKVKFTTFGNKVACEALYEVISTLDGDSLDKVVTMMENK